MDHLAHSLTGAALGEAGLRKKTGLRMATLIIAANLADVDALGLVLGENLAWRRGWTQGPIAMMVLPPLLVCAMVLFDRWQARRGTRPAERLPIHVGYSNGTTAGRFVRTLRLPPVVAPNQVQRAPDGPQADDQHGAQRR